MTRIRGNGTYLLSAPLRSSCMSTPSDLPRSVRASWHGFLETYEPLRTDLYRYCRHLTRSPWDAEDLAQDTLARAFVTLAQLGSAPPNPRAWLFRVAYNLWVDRARRRREEPLDADVEDASPRPIRRAGVRRPGRSSVICLRKSAPPSSSKTSSISPSKSPPPRSPRRSARSRPPCIAPGASSSIRRSPSTRRADPRRPCSTRSALHSTPAIWTG